ncbi:MAG: NAD-dependent epimerase/dehydratase family protein [Jiangellaceae bacterium]|nr:NAD-dependent epimerase/dehydratase family protein [Jiangellaceae bacterium]
MRLLVLGGTHFVGRAVVEAALARGDQVTTLTRGVSGPPPDGAKPLYADRTRSADLVRAVGDRTWDAVIDTWAGAPVVVAESAALLSGRLRHYGYVSSASVYSWPIPLGVDETASTVAADPRSFHDSDYSACKRGAELAVLEHFAGRALLARAGLILGPHEDVGRLPWWLHRLHQGGRVVAPGPAGRPLQLIDARDLAEWMLRCADGGTTGTFNAVSRPGHTTMEELLTIANETAGGSAELIWVSPDAIARAGVSAWTELPIWTPPTGELAGLHAFDVTAAHANGLRCRPIAETVRDTWHWLQDQAPASYAHARTAVGLDQAAEERIHHAAAQAGMRLPGRPR